jgi:hypothetical protein
MQASCSSSTMDLLHLPKDSLSPCLPHTNSSECSLNNFASSTISEAGKSLVKCIVLLAVTHRIPTLYNEMLWIFDLHYHSSLPLLVVLGALPYVIRQCHADSELSDAHHGELRLASSIADFDDDSDNSAQDDEYLVLDDPPLAADWGHFAELDEKTLREQDLAFATSMPSPFRRSSCSFKKLPGIDEDNYVH